MEGLWENFRKNGKLEERGNWKSNKLEGVSEFFDENGQLIQISTYIDGKKDGPQLNFDIKGGVTQDRCYVNGKEKKPFTVCSNQYLHMVCTLQPETLHIGSTQIIWEGRVCERE